MLRGVLNKSIIAYLNNIFIYLKILSEYKEDIKKVLICLEQVRFLLELEKCEFYKNKIQFLGYIVITEGVEINLKKL